MARHARGLAWAHRSCEPGEKRHQPDARERREGCLEAGGSQHEAAEDRTDDLAEIGNGIQPSELHAAYARQFARHGPGRRPECRPRNDEGELPRHENPEALGEHEPEAGADDDPARGDTDVWAADAVA